MFLEPLGPLSNSILSRTTRWHEPLLQLINVSFVLSQASKQRKLYELVNGFLEDIECGIVYSAAEHLATQMSFLTSGYAARAQLDVQVKLSNLTQDLGHMASMISYPRQANDSVWKCPLGHENDVTSKTVLPVTKNDFVETLQRFPSLVQRLCTVYIQDFICLGFPLPPECEQGSELQWTDGQGIKLATTITALPRSKTRGM